VALPAQPIIGDSDRPSHALPPDGASSRDGDPAGAARLARLALATATFTYLLIVFGAVVRTTDSGMGCGTDWPLCNGRWLPPLEAAPIIEWTHRLLGALVSPAILAVVVGSWLWARHRRDLIVPATIVPLLLAVQIGLGRVVVLLDLPTMVVMVHLIFAQIILALLVWVAVVAGSAGVPPAAVRAHSERPSSQAVSRFSALVWTTTAATFGLLLIGAYVRASGAGWACIGFPGCNGQALPFGVSPLTDLHLTHRLAGYAVAILVGATAWSARRLVDVEPAIPRLAAGLVGLVLAQIGIGAVAVSVGPGAVVQSAHVAGATAVWATAVALAALTWRASRSASLDSDARLGATAAQRSPREVAAAYFALTKPRVMVLLLITTLAAMLMAERGLPPVALIFFTLLGGALAAGGAGAINHYLDRDVDALMGSAVGPPNGQPGVEDQGRRAARPIPMGLVPPRHALLFGIALGALSFVLLAATVNLLSAALSLLALLFYVFVYTRWLKRVTPLNIVIGGAAGAVPPVVGIAAVTGEVSPLAIYLFSVIFLWTPPHFWALSLLIRRQYEAAGIPMLPIVRGDDEARRQILLYSLAMVALTVAVSWFGWLGSLYLVSAISLGGIFLYHAARLVRDADAPAARRLFRYSMVYLALLFAAMVVDRQALL
jgi:protoheme IX farnesyltransferase